MDGSHVGFKINRDSHTLLPALWQRKTLLPLDGEHVARQNFAPFHTNTLKILVVMFKKLGPAGS